MISAQGTEDRERTEKRKMHKSKSVQRQKGPAGGAITSHKSPPVYLQLVFKLLDFPSEYLT